MRIHTHIFAMFAFPSQETTFRNKKLLLSFGSVFPLAACFPNKVQHFKNLYLRAANEMIYVDCFTFSFMYCPPPYKYN